MRLRILHWSINVPVRHCLLLSAASSGTCCSKLSECYLFDPREYQLTYRAGLYLSAKNIIIWESSTLEGASQNRIATKLSKYSNRKAGNQTFWKEETSQIHLWQRAWRITPDWKEIQWLQSYCLKAPRSWSRITGILWNIKTMWSNEGLVGDFQERQMLCGFLFFNDQRCFYRSQKGWNRSDSANCKILWNRKASCTNQ